MIFGIVCYHEKYWETQSFKDLVASFKSKCRDTQLYICIYDNTDTKGWDLSGYVFEEDNIKLHYYSASLNPGISAAFNYFADFARSVDVNWLVFFDQDTSIPLDLYDKYIHHIRQENTSKIVFPKVYSGSQLMSPSYYKYYRASLIKKPLAGKILLNDITAINSGLMIQRDFFESNSGYNENLRVDFCDHEFIERINGKNITADVADVSLNQDFSEVTNDEKKAIFRYRIYIKDLIMYSANKNKLIIFLRVDLPHLLKLTLKYRSLSFINIRLKHHEN
jgi:hypothetical protein